MTKKTSPVAWVLDVETEVTIDGLPWTTREIRDAAGNPVAYVLDDEDARRICRAINCHDDLVAALQDALNILSRPHVSAALHQWGQGGNHQTVSQRIVDALGKVRGDE